MSGADLGLGRGGGSPSYIHSIAMVRRVSSIYDQSKHSEGFEPS